MKYKLRHIVCLIGVFCIIFSIGILISRTSYKDAAASETSDTDTSKNDIENNNPTVTPTPVVTKEPQVTKEPVQKEYTGKINLDKEKLTLKQGNSYQLKTKLTKENLSGKNITYKSSNKKIITVSQTGKIKALHWGTAKIIVTLEKVKAVCNVTVTKDVTITISAAGDCTFSSDIKASASTNFYSVYNKNNDSYFFKNVKPIFSKDDMTIVNFEGTLSNRGTRAIKKWAFRGKPSYINILKKGSVEAVAFANNHVYDYGKISYTDTISSFKKANIKYSSYSTIGTYQVKGIKIGMISIQEVGRSDAASILRAAIKKMKKEKPDLLVVSFHWGIEYTKNATKSQINLSRIAINEGGADLVLGHHPHVIQPIEKYKSSYIVYSLGNFCFGGNSNPPDKDTIIYQQTFTFHNDKLVHDNKARIIPCSVSSVSTRNNYQPTPSKGTAKQHIIDRMNGYCKQYKLSFDKNGNVK